MTNTPNTRETADHAELARLAEDASSGPWSVDADDTGRTIVASPVEIVARDTRHNSEFIAAFNPATAKTLLSEIAALRGERDYLKRHRDRLAITCQRRLDDWRSAQAQATQAERQRDEARDTIASTVAKADWMQGHLSGERSSIDRETIELVVSECRAYCHLQALANQGADQ